jgi:hypothetical protein
MVPRKAAIKMHTADADANFRRDAMIYLRTQCAQRQSPSNTLQFSLEFPGFTGDAVAAAPRPTRAAGVHNPVSPIGRDDLDYGDTSVNPFTPLPLTIPGAVSVSK